METESKQFEKRVLVHMPTGRDGELVCSTLTDAGFNCSECGTLDDLVVGIEEGVGAVLLAEEALKDGAVPRLIEVIGRQPVWSDLPIVLFSSSSRSAESQLATLGSNFNINVVERPIRITMLLSSVRTALRARSRQYEARDMLSQLEQADRQKDLFLATLSHELRTPLNSILGWLQLMRTNALNGSESEHALDVIERNARAQAEMISDILFVSRIITGKLEIKHEPIYITAVLAQAIDIIRPSAEAKSITVTFDPDDSSSVLVEGDRERLQQVYLNLLTNAVKFTPEGGEIAVLVRLIGPNVEVEISDSGLGIKPEFLPYLFQRFAQADSTYTRRSGGLGLGLAIVRHLAELHGGTVTAHSDGENTGARFVVTLPVAEVSQSSDRAAPAKSSKKREPQAELRGLRVLLVEDDNDSREMLGTILRFHGIEVTSVDSAADALAAVETSVPDVLVSDVGMPGEDGYDLIAKVRALPDDKGGKIPAVALTGYVSVQERSQALAAGFQEHLAKPVDTDMLVDLLVQFAAFKDTLAETAS